jgi:hypothetical protein
MGLPLLPSPILGGVLGAHPKPRFGNTGEDLC